MQPLVRHVEKWAASWTVGLSLLMLFGDYATGPYISFPILFVFPVALMAWNRPARWAIMLAAFLCAIRQVLSVQWETVDGYDFSIVSINTLISMGVLFLVALLIARVASQQRALQRKVSILEGILPVCSFCKKIRDKDDRWQHIETYITNRSQAQFSHSICPDCGQRHYDAFYGAPVTEPGGKEKPVDRPV